jgi:nucleoside-triphosphatase
MYKAIFITGPPRIGKSTVLIKTIDLLKKKGLKVGGIITPEIRKAGKRTGFSVKDIYSGNEGVLADIEKKTGPKLGKYRVNIEDFERIALPALDFAVKKCDVVAIDEVGRLEFFSKKFQEKVYEIVLIDKPLIAVIHRNFIKQFESFGEVITVTEKNRGKLPRIIFNKITQSLRLN